MNIDVPLYVHSPLTGQLVRRDLSMGPYAPDADAWCKWSDVGPLLRALGLAVDAATADAKDAARWRWQLSELERLSGISGELHSRVVDATMAMLAGREGK